MRFLYSQRMDAELAATICQVHLWAPSHWFTKQLPSNSEVRNLKIKYGGNLENFFILLHSLFLFFPSFEKNFLTFSPFFFSFFII